MSGTIRMDRELQNFDSARVPIKSSARIVGEIPYLGASGEVDRVMGHTHDGDYLCVSEDGENLRSRNTPIAWVQRGKFWANNHVHVLGGLSLARLRFYEAALAVAPVASYLTGSAQPKLSQAALHSIEVPSFSFSDQTGIGEILGALVDKVSANEDIATRSRDLAASIASSSGSKVRLSTVARIVRKTVNPTALGVENVRHFSLPAFDLGAAVTEPVSGIKSSKNLLESPVVLVSKLNPRIRRIWAVDQVPDGVSVASAEFVALVPTAGSVGELWAALLDPQFTQAVLERTAGTTGSHQRVKPVQVLDLEIRDASTLSAERRELLDSLCRRVNGIADENQRLAATRDEFVQLLMSGKITVKDAEKTVEEVV